MLPNIDEVSVFAAETGTAEAELAKIFDDGVCATGFTSGEQTFKPSKVDSTLGTVEAPDWAVVVVTVAFNKSTGVELIAVETLTPELSNEKLKKSFNVK